MKAFVALAAGAIATLSSGHVTAREVRTTFSFVVTIDERVWSYNENVAEDVNVLMPMGSPWRCVRQRLTLPADGFARGAIECSSDAGKTSVVVSASCGLGQEDHHNSAIITAGKSQVTVSANCNTSVYETVPWLGF
jgi:hypothetical protein